jgi:tetratricopeptide (TPR) repeat protein
VERVGRLGRLGRFGARRRSAFAHAVLATAIIGAPATPAPAAPGEVVNLTREIVPRAPECAALFSNDGATANLWQKAKLPALDDHCRSLQKALQRIFSGSYKPAIEHADQAEKLTPGQPGPFIVRGLAYARWGRDPQAAEAFERARALHPRALDDAMVLDAWASVLVRLRRLDDARRAYRALLPRVSGPQGLCGVRAQCDAAGLAYLSAGLLAMHEGPTGLDEAIAILREARAKAEPRDDVRRIASLALTLALDRRGEIDQARELAVEVAKGRGVPTEIPAEIVARFVSPPEGLLLRAIGLSSTEPAAAAELARTWLSTGGEATPWAAHARGLVVRLDKAKGK